MIFIFRKYDSDARVIIYAESYIEAKETLFDLNPYADEIYNIIEYKLYNVVYPKFFDVLNIPYWNRGYPLIISEKEFKLLEDNKVFLDKQFNDIHNTKVLQKNDSLLENTNHPLLMGKSEFVNMLKENADIISRKKKNIYNMLNIVGDIWVEYFYVKGLSLGNKYVAYGKSRYQCNKIIEKLKEKYENKFISYNKQELLISYYGTLESYDINRYNEMVDFMKNNNIKKFPFTTYIEEEQ